MFNIYNSLGWWCGPQGWSGKSFFGIPFFHGPFGFIFTLLFWGAIIWLSLSIAQNIFNALRSKNSQALEILKNRFAKGEITLEEFENMKKLI